MFQVYNTVLRQFPADVFAELDAGGNRYPTTIHVLVSAVAKLARTARLPAGLELYRGLGGLTELPDSFFRPDEHGCRGYMEWGFLSTSSDRATAIQVNTTYASISQEAPSGVQSRVGKRACLLVCLGRRDRISDG